MHPRTMDLNASRRARPVDIEPRDPNCIVFIPGYPWEPNNE